jgi:acyl-CoA oxidase
MMTGISNNDYSLMDTCHHLLAGFKSGFTDQLIFDTETCRKSCGGAGFSSFSGFTEVNEYSTPMPTYEGDNTVMSL